jgi:hypothetical protein
VLDLAKPFQKIVGKESHGKGTVFKKDSVFKKGLFKRVY